MAAPKPAAARGLLHAPTRSLGALGGHLGPGLHLIGGAHASGKTQWLVQVAVEASTLNRPALLALPDVRPSEAALRVAAALSGQPWSSLEADRADSELGRLSGAPFTLHALGGQDLETLDLPHGGLLAVDLPVSDSPPSVDHLRELRRRALRDETTIWASWPTGGHPSSLDTPLDAATGYGFTHASLAVSDSVWVLAPETTPACRVFCAKSRRGPTGAVSVRFSGARFEDEPEMDLDLD